MRILLFISLFAFNGLAQDLVVVSKVTKDSIAIKWLPNNYAQLELITSGATISRAISDKPTNFQLVNFTNAKTWQIAPTKERIDLLGSSEQDEKFKALVEPILDGTTDKEQQNFAMLTATVENMVNPNFQVVLGNILIDTDFDKKATYVYKIEIKDVPTSYIYVDTYQETFYSEISDFDLSLDRKKTVSVQWNSNAVQKEALGFLIEHSMDKKREGSYLSELPHIPFKTQFEAKDKKANVIDNPEAGHFHFYRVHGLDPFGHSSLLSEWKSIYVPLLINAHVQIDTIIAKSTEREIKVSAALLDKKANIKTWELLRSEQKDSGYGVIETKSYSDSIASFSVNGKSSGDHFYYKIQAINKDDTVSSLPYYFFTLDQVPPVPPTELNGTVDSTGIVQLNWTASLDDDIQGYKVFRGNQKREEFTEQTTRLSTELIFIDTLALDNLTSEVYYFVQAVDLNFNVSAQSDTVLLLKPDTIPPMAAAIHRVKMVDTSLVISWANSDSEDLEKTILIRNHSDTIPLKSGQAEYTDFDLVPARHYTYQLLTEDKSENQSYSQEIGQYYETGYRKPMRGFKVAVDRDEKLISLVWNTPQDEVFSYQIFRSKNDGKLGLIKTITDPKELQYIDKQLSIGTKYTYSIKYVNMEGIHSLPANQEIIY
jgi:hypothetical protein